MIVITPEIQIDEREIQEVFVRASGSGGQNVNKVSTAVQLRFNTLTNSLPEDVRDRLVKLARKRINEEGVLVIEAGRFRTQEQNRQDALNRLLDLLRQSSREPNIRVKTRSPLWVKRRRLEAKRRRGETKRLRNRISPYEGERS